MYSKFNTQKSVNKYVDQVIVLCLPNRKNYITNTLTKMDILFTIHNAILGKSINIQNLITKGIISKNHTFKNNNEIACALGHLSIINEYLINGNTYGNICVFEDDIEFNDDYYNNLSLIMESLPKDYEFLNLSRCWANCISEKKINDYINITQKSLCSSSYILNKKGAKKIIQNAFPMKDPIDIYITNLMTDPINLKFYSSKRLFTQNRINITSSLQNTDYCLECNNYYLEYNNFSYFFLILFVIFLFFFYNNNNTK